jgi:hypothetical protein
MIRPKTRSSGSCLPNLGKDEISSLLGSHFLPSFPCPWPGACTRSGFVCLFWLKSHHTHSPCMGGGYYKSALFLCLQVLHWLENTQSATSCGGTIGLSYLSSFLVVALLCCNFISSHPSRQAHTCTCIMRSHIYDILARTPVGDEEI